MPDKITFDEALAAPPQQITFDEAFATRQPQMRPGGNLDVRTGEELVPGQGLPGAPNYQRPMIAPAPQAAPASNFGAALKSKLVEDEGTKVRLVAESIGVDPKRVGIVNGKPVFVNDEGKLQLVSGPISRGAAGLIANAPEMAIGGLGSFAASPVIGGTLGAMGGRGLKRAAAGLVTGEPQTVSGNLQDIAIEGGIAALSGGVGKGLVALGNRGKIIDLTPAQIKTAEQARANIKAKTGIDLDIAQASGDRKLLSLRDYASRYPGKSAQMIQAADEAVQGQFNAATNRVLNLIDSAKPAELTGQNAINVAGQTITLARRKVQEQVRPLYDAAYATKTEIKNPRMIALSRLPEIQTAIDGARRIINLDARKVVAIKDQPLSLQMLDYTKQQLDDEVERLTGKGLRNQARALAGARDEMTAFLDNVSKADLRTVDPNASPDQIVSLYKLARQRYGELVEASVVPLENSLLGVLAKMQPKNAQLAARIFSDPGVTPEQIAILKGGLSRSNPDAYRGLVRQWLGQKWDEAQDITQGGDTINPAGKFLKSVMKNPAQRERVKAMLPADASVALEDLMLAAEKLARTPLGASRVAGSNTARDMLITEQLKGNALGTLKWLMFPRQSIQDAAEQRVMDSGIEKLAEALTDPLKRAQLDQITRMKPSTAQAIRLGTFLSGQVAKTAAEDMGETQMPRAPYQ